MPAKKTPARAPKREANQVPDMGLALKAPLTASEQRPLLKIGDADRAIAARAAKLYAKYEKVLNIPGVSSEGMLASIRATEAIIPNETLAQTQAARLQGARLQADDGTWRAIVKLHRRLQNEGDDNPQALSAFKFLMDYIANRSLKVEEPSHGSKANGGNGAVPNAKGGAPSAS